MQYTLPGLMMVTMLMLMMIVMSTVMMLCRCSTRDVEAKIMLSALHNWRCDRRRMPMSRMLIIMRMLMSVIMRMPVTRRFLAVHRVMPMTVRQVVTVAPIVIVRMRVRAAVMMCVRTTVIMCVTMRCVMMMLVRGRAAFAAELNDDKVARLGRLHSLGLKVSIPLVFHQLNSDLAGNVRELVVDVRQYHLLIGVSPNSVRMKNGGQKR